jgi:hypothetical protein
MREFQSAADDVSRTQPSRWKLCASGLFFFAYLILQTLIPTYALFTDGWFLVVGWTMYTHLRERPGFAVVYEGGAKESLEQIQQRLGVGIIVGNKVDLARFVPPHLCASVPGAREVLIYYPRSRRKETYACGP